MTSSETARVFFGLLEKQQWEKAATFLSSAFVESYRPHALHQIRGIRSRYVSEADLEIPAEDVRLFALWLRLTDRRAMAEREVAQARHEQPDEPWRAVGGMVAPDRVVVGEVAEDEGRSLVVYRVHGPNGQPKALQLVREDEGWRVNSDEFTREGHVGVSSLPEDPRAP